jgi:CBS domain containing-hemolysin-like protein
MNLLLNVVWMAALATLLVAGTVAAYLRLQMRRLTPVAALQLFQSRAGRLQADRERVGVSISALHGATMALFAAGVMGLLTLNWPDHLWNNLGTSILLVLIAVAIFDQMIPFVLVARGPKPEVVLGRWMPVLRKAVFVALPLTFPILISTGVRRLLEPLEEEVVPRPQPSLEEFLEASEREGLIEAGQGELMKSVLAFGTKVVREVMTPRPEMVALDVDAPIEQLRRLFREKRFTRYPVYRGQLDQILGIVNVRDLMGLPPDEQARAALRSLVRPVSLVPETKRIRELLKELQQTTTQMAIAIDEYGSVAGLVTVEDIVEELVGEIRDEWEPHAGDIVKLTSDTYLVAGNTELAHLSNQLHLHLEGRDFSTVAGLILSRLGHVPLPGEKVELDGMVFEVLEANPRTVLKVRLRFPSKPPAPAPAHV